jgi:hypothetical protein
MVVVSVRRKADDFDRTKIGEEPTSHFDHQRPHSKKTTPQQHHKTILSCDKKAVTYYREVEKSKAYSF